MGKRVKMRSTDILQALYKFGPSMLCQEIRECLARTIEPRGIPPRVSNAWPSASEP